MLLKCERVEGVEPVVVSGGESVVVEVPQHATTYPRRGSGFNWLAYGASPVSDSPG